ncbi:Protein of unknown function (DUF3618) [Streptomyces sp. MnatMP-M77]|uniref:DUF3618 domain-containing protein n=1 Tax=unclassified Streptomyces TaxID=2593676 RepID=UPI000804FAD4|nr:DUF3618 domain-containing protein [Streptomyces sp. MnatMP-M77]MYT80911.1 DUF3618 domain-containing protein [Streptomyces sp. SID8364]SBV06115.1 Protein of unknown function (DUF3618) [Streptomyces sp. MnatMP-M77]
MGTQPDELKAGVESTRAHLAHNVDRLADKVTPGKVARRKAGNAQRRITRVKERVMGAASGNAASGTQGVADTAGQAGEAVKHTVEQVGHSVRETPEQVTQQTQGNPVAAGIIAFGAGMLAATLLPTTDAEERVGAQLREHSDELLEPVKQTAQDVAQDVKQEMREPATEAVDAVKNTAQDAAQTTKQKAQDAGQETATGLREVGKDASREVGN